MISALQIVVCVLLFILFYALGKAISVKNKFLAEWADLLALLAGVVAVAVYLKLMPLA